MKYTTRRYKHPIRQDKSALINNFKRGFTLLELLYTLVVSMILLSAGLPGFKSMIQKSEIASAVNQLRGALFLARETAIQKGQTTALCPTTDHKTCGGSWNQGYMVFVDNNHDRLFNNNDELLQTYRNHNDDIILSWRAFGFKSSLQWLKTGITNHQNGTFEICHQSNMKLAKALIVSKSGNVRLSKDSNGDGLDENASGDQINC